MKTSKFIPKPAFFDIFGIIIFIFIIWVGYTNLNSSQPLGWTVSILILIIGITGLAIDSINVFRTYLK